MEQNPSTFKKGGAKLETNTKIFCSTFFKSGKYFAPLFLKVEKWKSGKVENCYYFAPLFLKVEKVDKGGAKLETNIKIFGSTFSKGGKGGKGGKN